MDQRLLVLESFGLSGYLARAYVALLDLGPAQARDVAERSAVPQGRIYDVLEKLHARGLIELLPEAPKRYRALPFEAFIDRELTFHQERAVLLERQREEILRTMQPTGDVPQQQAEYLVLRGRRAVQERIAVLIAGSRDTLLLGTEGTGHRLGLYEDAIREAVSRGGRIRVALPVTKANRAAVEQALQWGVEVRHADPGGAMALALFDRDRALFHRASTETGSKGTDASAILLEEPDLAEGLRGLGEGVWQRCATLEERQRELESGRRAGTLTTYRRLADAAPAIAASRARVQRDVRVAAPADLLAAILQDAEGAARDLAQRRIRLRVLATVASPEHYDALERLMRAGAEVRVAQAPDATVALLHDESEAFTVAAELLRRCQRGQAAAELVVGSDSADHVASLVQHFEAAWAQGLPADKGREPTSAAAAAAARRLPPA